MQRVYLDNAATTPLFPQVAEKMADYLTHNFGNPSSLHSFGREVRADMDKARNQAAELINAKEGEIFFTSGGTEADNLAILGTAQYKGKGHIITSKVEHHAVLHACEALDEKIMLSPICRWMNMEWLNRIRLKPPCGRIQF